MISLELMISERAGFKLLKYIKNVKEQQVKFTDDTESKREGERESDGEKEIEGALSWQYVNGPVFLKGLVLCKHEVTSVF